MDILLQIGHYDTWKKKNKINDEHYDEFIVNLLNELYELGISMKNMKQFSHIKKYAEEQKRPVVAVIVSYYLNKNDFEIFKTIHNYLCTMNYNFVYSDGSDIFIRDQNLENDFCEKLKNEINKEYDHQLEFLIEKPVCEYKYSDWYKKASNPEFNLYDDSEKGIAGVVHSILKGKIFFDDIWLTSVDGLWWSKNGIVQVKKHIIEQVLPEYEKEEKKLKELGAKTKGRGKMSPEDAVKFEEGGLCWKYTQVQKCIRILKTRKINNVVEYAQGNFLDNTDIINKFNDMKISGDYWIYDDGYVNLNEIAKINKEGGDINDCVFYKHNADNFITVDMTNSRKFRGFNNLKKHPEKTEKFIKYLKSVLGENYEFMLQRGARDFQAGSKDQFFYVFLGRPSSGKSSYLDLTKKLFGKFYGVLDSIIFKGTTKHQGMTHTEELSKVIKKRIVVVNEPEKGIILDGGKICSKVGANDTIQYREIRGKSQESIFQAKLIFNCNLALNVKETGGVNRRMKNILWQEKFVDEKDYVEGIGHTIKNSELIAELLDDDDYIYIFEELLMRSYKNKITIPKNIEEFNEEVKDDNIYTFDKLLDKILVPSEKSFVEIRKELTHDSNNTVMKKFTNMTNTILQCQESKKYGQYFRKRVNIEVDGKRTTKRNVIMGHKFVKAEDELMIPRAGSIF